MPTTKKKPASKAKPNSKPRGVKKKKKGVGTTNSSKSSKSGGSKAGSKSKKSKPSATKESPSNDRPVVYPEPKVKLFSVDKDPLDATKAKEIIGWQEESENIKFSGFGFEPGNFHFRYVTTDDQGNETHHKVRLNNNVNNRYIDQQLWMTYRQDVLRRRWRFNGEPVIVGRTGILLDGQHTLLAVIMADIEWNAHPGKWLEWQEAPSIDKLVVFGVEEDDDTVNTMNSGKPRSLADVLFRSPYYANLSVPKRKALSKALDVAVRFVWDRTGAAEVDVVELRRTHLEALDFLERHLKLVECVTHICTEDESGEVRKIISPGYASGLMYLMAASDTEVEEDGTYGTSDKPSEELIDFGLWDKAADFWTELAAGDKKMQAVRSAIAELYADEDDEEVPPSMAERIGIIANAWEQYKVGKPITAKDLELTYEQTEAGKVLTETPAVGGIDRPI